MNEIDINLNRSLYLDCSSGISGDMMVAALLDLGADRKVLTAALSSLPLDGYQIEIRDVIKSGLRACDFHVCLDELHENHDHDMDYLHGSGHAAELSDRHSKKQAALSSSGQASEQPGEHSTEHPALPDAGHAIEQQQPAGVSAEHSHNPAIKACQNVFSQHLSENSPATDSPPCPTPFRHHPSEPSGSHPHGRNLQDITEILQAGKLTNHALELALRIFRIVAEAESQVHGKPLDQVHFHEVGAVDSIVDIAAVAVCIDNLGIEQVIIPCLTEGQGQVRCQHGLLPVPVPATASILTAYQLPLHISDVQGELVTPTGAAIAAALRTDSRLPQEFKILRTGLGAGKREYQTAGVLRAMLIEGSGTDYDKILILETNMDDCTGEAMGFVMEELLAAGALDVFYTPIYMKKHRPAYQLSVLFTPDKRAAMEALIFRHTTTIGLRVHEAERTKLPRRIFSLETPWGMADIKCCQYGEELYFYPENDSIQLLAKQNNMSYTEMYHEVKKYASENHTIL